jgi:uncharacterized membrane protein
VKRLKKLETAANLIFLVAAMSIAFSGLSLSLKVPTMSVLFLITIYILQNLRKPIMVAYISSKAPSAALTSTLSVESQLKTFFTASAAPFIGWIADISGVGTALLTLGAIMMAVSLLLRLK